MANTTRLLACWTCPRYAANPNHQITAGAALGAEILSLMAGSVDQVRIVNCLSGCKNPSNVTLDGDSKIRLRFSQLGPGDGPAVIAAAKLHADSPDGKIDPEKLPAALRDRLTAKSPPWLVK